MGILDKIKKEADDKGLFIQSAEEEQVTKLFNKMFYTKHNIEEETKFVHAIMMRGSEQQERIGLHASAIIVSDKAICYRQQVLSLIYKQLQGEQISPGLKRIFEEGNAIHEKWQRLFIRAGYGKADDMDVSQMNDKYMLSFTPDAILQIPEINDGKKIVVEIKSMNSFPFKKLKQHASGHKQMQFYMWLTGIRKGMVLVDSKNDSEFRVFMYDYDFEVVKPFILRLKKIKKAYDKAMNEGKMIKRHKDCTSYGCDKASKCPMKDACFNRGQGRQRL